MHILSLATAVPDGILTQEEAARRAVTVCCETTRQEQVLHALYRKSAIQSRHTIITGDMPPFYQPGEAPTTAERMQRYVDEAGPLAERAARTAIEHAGIPPCDVTHIVTVSCTGFSSPGVDLYLMEALGLSPDAQRTNVGFMGCHGAINGLRTAQALAAANPDAVILLCCVELCSLHMHYGWDARQLTPNALFADGAAAMVGTGAAHTPRILSTSSRVIPGTAADMTWHIGDHGFQMTLSARVPDLIATNVLSWLTDWLARAGLEREDIRLWAIHPGGPRVLDAVQEALGLGDEAVAPSREILRTKGNMSSGTVLFVLEEARRRGQQFPAVLMAFGPGLTAEGALIV